MSTGQLTFRIKKKMKKIEKIDDLPCSYIIRNKAVFLKNKKDKEALSANGKVYQEKVDCCAGSYCNKEIPSDGCFVRIVDENEAVLYFRPQKAILQNDIYFDIYNKSSLRKITSGLKKLLKSLFIFKVVFKTISKESFGL